MNINDFSGTNDMFADDTLLVPLEYAKQLEDALIAIFNNPNSRYEVEAQLGDIRPDWIREEK